MVFPDSERFGLCHQLRRAAVSLTSNIAEGFGRVSLKEKQQFYSIARGSLSEIQSQLMIAKDIGYIPAEEYNILFSLSAEVSKLINGLRKSLDKLNT